MMQQSRIYYSHVANITRRRLALSEHRWCPPCAVAVHNKLQNKILIRALSTTKDEVSSSDLTRIFKRNTQQEYVIDEPEKDNMQILSRLYEIAKPERNLIYASAATLGITSSITLLLPYACGQVLDMAILESTNPSDGESFSPFTVALGLFTLTGTAGIGVYARSMMLNIAGNRIVSRMRRMLFGSVLAQEAAFFDLTKSGDLLSRLSNDTHFVKSVVTTEAVSGLRGLVMSIGSTSLLFYTSPTLAVVSLLSIPPVFLTARIVGRSLKRRQKTVQELHGKATNVAEEVFGGHRTVQLFSAEKHEYDRYSDAVVKAHEKEMQVGRTRAAFDGIVHVAANGAVLLVLGYGGTLVLAQEMTAGDLTGFLMYSLLTAGNFSSLSSTYVEIAKSLAASGRCFNFIDRQPQIQSSFQSKNNSQHQQEKIDDGPVSIRFEDIAFSYPARQNVPVLKHFSLDIEAGETVSLVGNSGCGKSTAGLLLARLYNVHGGKIYLNDKDIMDLDPSYLRGQIGVVSQEPILFAGSIADNIRYGKLCEDSSSVSDEEVIEAARAAHVLDFTKNLPDGLDTQVGHRGTQLSGGQKQRVAIARIILKNPRIVILDEATSALDSQSEYHINQALKAMTEGRTVISIAHRLSTIREADRIAMIKDGKVVEIGSFDELLELKGEFHKLVGQQIAS